MGSSTGALPPTSRLPRVRIEYEVELYGAQKKVEVPFVMGVMADLSGDAKEPLAPVADRKFLEVHVDNFDARMKSIRPRVSFSVSNTLTGEGNLAVDLTFECMDDFAPGAVARRVPGVGAWLNDRERLVNLVVYQDGMRPEPVAKIQSMFEDRELLELLAARPVARHPTANAPDDAVEIPATTVAGRDEFFLKSLTQAFGLQGPRPELERTVETFARRVIRRGVRPTSDWMSAAMECVSEIDSKLSEQLNLILHHERFQQLESAWRGLHYLVTHAESDELLKIRVMNVSKTELGESLQLFDKSAWDESPLVMRLDCEYGLGGEPYGCIVGDYYFDHSPTDVALLTSLARIAAHVHAPFLAGAAPSLMGMQSWQELVSPVDLSKVVMAPDYAAWRSLRDTDEARYVGLAMPRFLARLPYGEATNPVDEFAFEEETGGGDYHRYIWANAAYAMAVNVGRSFRRHGWCTAIHGIESGGIVEGLPVHTFPSDEDGVDHSVGPIEIAISERREKELADCGFMPLLHKKNSDVAVFISAQSLQKPAECTTPEATANARLAARLPQVFAESRFAQGLITLCCNASLGSFMETAEYERYMNDWLQKYVQADRDGASDAERAARPLRHALVTADEVAGRPGVVVARLELEPHYPISGKLKTHFLLRWPWS